MYFLVAALIGLLAHPALSGQLGELQNPLMWGIGTLLWIAFAAALRSTICSEHKAATFAAGVVQSVVWSHVYVFLWLLIERSSTRSFGDVLSGATGVTLMLGTWYCVKSVYLLPLGVLGAFTLRLLSTGAAPGARPLKQQ